MAWVYILKTKSGKYYIGSTTNINQRLKEHKNAKTLSAKRLKYETCVLIQEYETLVQAVHIEKKIKNMKRRDYIEKIIKDGYIKLA